MTSGPALPRMTPSASEPARSFEQHALPPLSFAETSEATRNSRFATQDDAPSRNGRMSNGAAMRSAHPAERDGYADGGDRRVTNQPAAPRFVVPTGLVDRVADPSALAAGQSVIAAGDFAADPADFAADSFDRLAQAEPAERSSSFGSRASSDVARRSDIPTPVDLPTTKGTKRNGSRSTTWGIIVVMIAVICFAASLLWSRLDDATGLEREEPVALKRRQRARRRRRRSAWRSIG